MGPFDKRQVDELRAAGIIQPSFGMRVESNQPTSADRSGSDIQQYWVILDNGRQLGPYTPEALSELVSEGKIGASTLVYAQGMPNPVPLSSLGIGRSAMERVVSAAADSGNTLVDVVHAAADTPGRVVDAMNQALGLEKLDEFSLTKFFSGIFQPRTQEDIVKEFCAGTPLYTPDIRNVHATWPSPWVFIRVLFFCAVLYVGLIITYGYNHNSNIIPAIMFVANFGVPFSCLVLMFELNIRRDVPFYAVVKAFLLGGVLSLFITLFLDDKVNLGPEAYWAGPIEETAKVLAAIFVASSFRNGRILTGTLIGCAIGAGFAAFESAGYAMNFFLGELNTVASKLGMNVKDMTLSQIMEIAQKGEVEIAKFLDPNFQAWLSDQIGQKINACLNDSAVISQCAESLRAMLAPCGHVVWTSITAGAYWRVLSLKVQQGERLAGDRKIDTSIFFDMRFLSIAVIPIILHMAWNAGIALEQFGNIAAIGYFVIAWVVLLRLVQAGINQVKEEKIKALRGQ